MATVWLHDARRVRTVKKLREEGWVDVKPREFCHHASFPQEKGGLKVKTAVHYDGLREHEIVFGACIPRWEPWMGGSRLPTLAAPRGATMAEAVWGLTASGWSTMSIS